MARIYTGPINYKDASGNWQPIDDTLHASSDGSVPGFANGANRFQLQLPQQIQGAPVRLTNGNDWVSFSLDGAGGSGSVSGVKETFDDALPNVDARYTSLGDGVNQDLVLKNPSAQRTFGYTIQTSPGLSAEKTAVGAIAFTDSSGQAQFTVLPPIMSDANGAESGPGDASYELSSIQGGYKLTMNADSAWLSSADRAWPVTIDPTTQVVDSYYDTFIRSTDPNTNYYGQSFDKVGWDSYGVRRALLYFDVQDTLPSGVQVLDATMNLDLSAETTTANVQVGAYRLTKIFTTSATWNAWDPPYTWDNPGGDDDSSFVTQTPVGGSLGTYSWDLSELVYDWEENTIVNDGILLKDVDETTGANLFSFNSGVASSNWPVLSVDYTTTVDEIDVNGTTEADQSAVTGTTGFAVPAAAGPTELDANGGTALYPTDYWSSDETDTPDGLQVVNTTGANTWGVSGAVIADSTGNEISGATVTLSSSTTTLTATSNSAGAFSFVDVPTTSPWTITISAPGYGTYTDTNFSPLNNETYEATISMTTAAQTYDLSDQAADNSPLAASSTPFYASQTRVPPTIRVAIHQQLAKCATGSYIKTRTYPWRYYLLHVTAAETHYDWPENVIKANMEAQQSFAWYYEIHQPLNEVGDVTNTTSTQCFKPQNLPLAHWGQWVNDVFQNRIAHYGDIQQSSYLSGTEVSSNVCDPELVTNTMYQWGSLSLGTTCVSQNGWTQYNNWKNIDNYYYTGSVRPSYRPTVPTTSFSRPTGKVTLNFASKVRNGAGHVSNVAWDYQLEAYESGAWHQIFYSKWEGAPEQNKSAIPLTYTVAPGGCYKYRVRGINPVGHSDYASFNGGNQICPG